MVRFHGTNDDAIRLSGSDKAEEVFFPVTSMVDVIFILLLFFVAITEVRGARVEIDLPEVSAASDSSAQGPAPVLLIEVDAESRIYVDGDPVEPGPALRGRIQRAAAAHPDGRVRVKGDAEARNSEMMEVLSELAAAGLGNVEFVVVRRVEAP